MERKIGYYWIKYVVRWQVAYWNGEDWYVIGKKEPILRLKDDRIGAFIGAGGWDVDASVSNCTIHCVSGSDERWVCQKCGELVDGRNVTFDEYHEGCGGRCV